MSATMTATAVRFHVGLHVTDLERSVQFYRVLLGVGPVRHLADYSKFELADPPLVLALIPNPHSAGGTLNHLGLRVPDATTLVEVQRRLEEVGIATQRQEGVECCYARQTKFWVTDPDHNLWEIYVFEEDLAHSGFDDPPLSPDVVNNSTVVWEHRLTDPLPERIPCDEKSVDEVRLEGTFNVELPAERVAAFLGEVKRVLRCGGRVAVHGLTGDKPFPGKPALPGLASLVQHVPVDVEVMAALASAGFQSLFFEKLGDIHCFHVGGVELREMRLVGLRPACDPGSASHAVTYKGPLAEVEDDEGNVYRRGEKVDVTERAWQLLQQGSAAGQFLFFPLTP
jgi:catechol 2,3-dioxygenase-like lactoylglutathione lyase family enzyme